MGNVAAFGMNKPFSWNIDQFAYKTPHIFSRIYSNPQKGRKLRYNKVVLFKKVETYASMYTSGPVRSSANLLEFHKKKNYLWNKRLRCLPFFHKGIILFNISSPESLALDPTKKISVPKIENKMSETDGAVVYHPERVTNQLEFSTEISFLGMATISHLSPLFFCRGVRNFRDFFFARNKFLSILFPSRTEEKGAGILFLKYRRLHSYSPIHLYVVSFSEKSVSGDLIICASRTMKME